MSLHAPIPSALYQYKLSGILCVNSACAHRARLTSPRAPFIFRSARVGSAQQASTFIPRSAR
eukprot:266452-Pelagomonas_calceolata.AAC.1